jgi:hypothetical protein
MVPKTGLKSPLLIMSLVSSLFRMVGTPNDETWPGVESFDNWNDEFPCWFSKRMQDACPKIPTDALNLLSVKVGNVDVQFSCC